MAVIQVSSYTPVYTSAPSDPTGTTDTTGKMMGLAGAFTPQFSGRALIFITGNLTNSTAAAGDGAKAQITYGTGTAPVNGAALTGTAVGSIQSSVLERATASDLQTFSLVALVTGLTVGTAIWLDIRLAAIVGGTALCKNINIVAIEI
jgi:hypothetical protein